MTKRPPRKPSAPELNPVDHYAASVVDGDVLACKWVKLACKRHLDDRKHAHKKGLLWDWDEAARVIQFLGFLKQSQGEWADKPLVLSPWQAFFVGSLYGWYRAEHKRWREVLDDGTVENSYGARRYREAYLEVARKNGKSTLLAGLGIYGFVGDGEPGAQVYAAATKRDQARIIWEEAARMVGKTPLLNNMVNRYQHNMHIVETASKFEPLSRDAKTADGFNPHLVIYDELHAHKTRELYDVLKSGSGARRQPLRVSITTAGVNRAGVCYQLRARVCKVLEGVLEDETLFGLVYTLDEGDDWRDLNLYRKANPNLGVTVKMADLRESLQSAQDIESEQASHRIKRCNQWVGAGITWVDISKWERCVDPTLRLEDFAGEPCMVGLDLASTMDITALRIVFRREDHYYAFGKYYLPEETVRANATTTHAELAGWANAGLITLTPGYTTDQNRIQDDIRALGEQFSIKEIAYDPWQAQKMADELAAEGFALVKVRPTVQNFSEPMKTWEGDIASGKYHHDGDPVMTWMVSNVTAFMDAKDNIYPRKETRENKIDGVVAELMARRLYVDHPIVKSIYETEGILTL